MHIWKKRSIIWICILCLLVLGVVVLCKKKDKDSNIKPTIQQSTEQNIEKEEIELPENTFEDENTVIGENPTDNDAKDQTTQSQNNSDISKETPEEGSQTPPSSKDDENSSRDPIVLPSIRLD